MKSILHNRLNLVVAAILGLCAACIVIADIHFKIPGTNIITDPREVFVTIGAALTGPVGAVIVGILSSVYDPTPEISLYVMLQHIIGALFVGLVYKRYLFEKLRMPYLLFGWGIVILCYYYVVYAPLYFLVSIAFPDLYHLIAPVNGNAFGSLLLIYKGWIPEVAFTIVISSLVLMALPRQFRRPLWGKSITSPVSFDINQTSSRFLRKLLSGNFLGFRLGIWYLLLSLIPFFIIKIFIQNDVRDTLLSVESSRLLTQVVTVSELSEPDKVSKNENYFTVQTDDYNFIITELKMTGDYGIEMLNTLNSIVLEPIIEKLDTTGSGIFLDEDNLICSAYARFPESNNVIVSLVHPHSLEASLDDLESKSTISLAVSFVIIASIAGIVVWIMIVFPIKSLTEASRKVGAGDYNISIKHENMADELALLGNSFNIMTANIKKAYFEQQKEMEERVKAEKERYEYEKELYYITENILDVIIQTDIKGKIIYASPSVEKTFGFSKEYIVGKLLFDFIHEEEREGFRSSFGEIIDKYNPSNQRFRQKQADGSYISVEAIGNPILDDRLKISSVIFTLRDVTDNIKYQESLKRAKEAAEKSDKIKSEFLAQMSHEIRTPVNTILNFAFLLQEEIEDKLSDEMKDGFAIIERGSNRLIRTIDSILNLSQLQFGNMDINKAYLDLYEIVEKVKIEFSHLALSKGLKINISKECTDCNVYIDNYTVTQLIANLVDNAIKYTRKGSIDIRISKVDSEFVLEISDTGIGMTDEFMEHIFEPFSQEETGYTRRFEGTGLGLALVKKYCEINKAEIEVESQKNEGTKFTIRFQDRRIFEQDND